ARKGKIKLELFKLKQTGEFDSFLSKFQELANESNMAQEDLILIFSHALKPKCALEVQIREPKTIEEAYKIAIKFEKNLKFISGYLKEHKPRKKLKSLKNGTKTNNLPCDTDDEKINCISLLADSISLLMTNGLINKKNVDRIVFDIGATMSIIAEDCEIKNGIRFWPDGTKVRLADDRIVDVCGKTEALEVNIGGIICELPMLILKHKEYNILRNDGIISKLAPRWLGPYKIFDHDERGNYFLQAETGSGLTQKFPSEKLKIAEKEVFETNVGEVEYSCFGLEENLFCSSSESKAIIETNEVCEHTLEAKRKFTEMHGYSDNLTILNKIHHLLFGIGYKWSKYCTTSDWQPIALEQEECWYMVEKKRCRIETDDYVFDKTMKCSEKICSFYEYPNPKFNCLIRIICMDINA
ncbi:hypothetical protein BpHYR1_003807, partial [Brachionus plicatilis]